MNERLERISKLKSDRRSRESYTKAKLAVSVPSQVKALRLKCPTPNQKELAKANGTHQSRLSMLEQPGEANVTLETLAWIASIHKVGVIVKFVPYSEMLQWENSYSQDEFNVMRLDEDDEFISPVKDAEISSFQVGSAGKASTYEVFNLALLGKDEQIEVITKVPTRKSFKRAEMVGNG